MARGVVMAHRIRLLMAALYADKYLIVQIKGTIGWLNLLESQLATTEFAARWVRRLDKGAHMISFHPICFGTKNGTLEKIAI